MTTTAANEFDAFVRSTEPRLRRALIGAVGVDRFVENFYLVAVPTRTEGGGELMEQIVALDADGNELFRGAYPPA